MCSSKEFSKLFNIEDYNYKLPGCFEEHKCSDCGLMFLNPYLEENELSFYYPQDYYSYRECTKTKRPIKNYILNPINVWNIIWDRVNKGNSWGRYLSKNRQGRLLDIGCGSAGYLKHMRKLNPEMELFGCDLYGPPNNSSLYELKIIYKNLSLFECRFADSFFDIVSVNHVLEHVPNPKELLSEINMILKPNGRLIIGVPNSRCVSYFLFGKYWYGLDAPRHILNYSDKNLTDVLIYSGFRINSVRFIGNSSYFLESLLFKLFKTKRKVTGLWSKSWFCSLISALLNPLVWVLNKIRLGNCIEVEANKG